MSCQVLSQQQTMPSSSGCFAKWMERGWTKNSWSFADFLRSFKISFLLGMSQSLTNSSSQWTPLECQTYLPFLPLRRCSSTGHPVFQKPQATCCHRGRTHATWQNPPLLGKTRPAGCVASLHLLWKILVLQQSVNCSDMNYEGVPPSESHLFVLQSVNYRRI